MRPRAALAAALVSALAIGALSFAPRPARADEASGKQHFKNGVDLYDKQDYERALTEFRAAYAELHLYVIKRNISLSLRGLQRYAAAIESLEEYLAEGGDKIDAQLREAAEATITEMSAHVGTVRVSVDAHQPPGTAPIPVVLTVDDEPVARDKAQLPVPIDAGVEHTFRAHADGFADGVAPVTVTPGQHDVPLRLELVPMTVTGMGTLRVHASVPNAVIRVDQGAPQQGDWNGDMRAGPHRVIVEAPGYSRVTADIAVTPDAIIELPVTMVAVGLPPPPPPVHLDEINVPRITLPQKQRPWYGIAGVTFQGENVRVGPGLLGGAGGAMHNFNGAALTLKLGRMLSRQTNAHFALEGIAELGVLNANPANPGVDSQSNAKINVYDWMIAPEITYRSGGNLQLLLGTAVGIEGQVIDANFIVNGQSLETKGNGVGGVWLFEIGGELRFKRAFVQLTGFFDIHWDASARDENGERYFLDNPAGRAGIRLMVGLPLF